MVFENYDSIYIPYTIFDIFTQKNFLVKSKMIYR